MAWPYTYKWQKYRQKFLAENYNCATAGCLNDAVVVDHIVPHKNNMELFWDSDNHQPLCKRCHDSKTGRFDGAFGNPIKKEGEAKPKSDCNLNGFPTDPNHPWNKE